MSRRRRAGGGAIRDVRAVATAREVEGALDTRARAALVPYIRDIVRSRAVNRASSSGGREGRGRGVTTSGAAAGTRESIGRGPERLLVFVSVADVSRPSLSGRCEVL